MFASLSRLLADDFYFDMLELTVWAGDDSVKDSLLSITKDERRDQRVSRFSGYPPVLLEEWAASR
jgi:hypothetical protein